MTLALYQARIIWKETAGLKGLELMKVLIRDQALYFLAYVLVPYLWNTSSNFQSVLAVSGAQIIGDYINGSLIVDDILALIGNTSFLSLMGSRLLFNMKEAGERGLNQGTNCSLRATASPIDFAGSPGECATEASQIEVVELEEVEEIREVEVPGVQFDVAAA